MPVLGRGPGDVDEVLYHRLGHALPDKFRHQVKMVVVADDDGRLLHGAGLFDHGVGEGLVHWDVARFPGVVHGGVDVWIVGWVPHVVLQEPEERVAQDVVVLVVDAPGSHHVAQVNLVPRERGPHVRGLAIVGDDPVAFTHGAGHPGELEFLGHRTEGGDYAATATAGLGTAVAGHLVFHRAAVAHQNHGPFRKNGFAKLVEFRYISHAAFPSGPFLASRHLSRSQI